MIKWDHTAFARIEDYIQGGSIDELSENDSMLLDAMHEMNSMRRKYGRKQATAYMRRTKQLSYRQAENLYEHTINIFYADDGIERKAMRNMLADEILKSAEVVRRNSKSAKDLEIYTKMVAQAYHMKGLDAPDDGGSEIPIEKPIIIYSNDSSVVKLPQVDRNELAAQIDALDIRPSEKSRLKKESLVEEVSFEDIIDETNIATNE